MDCLMQWMQASFAVRLCNYIVHVNMYVTYDFDSSILQNLGFLFLKVLMKIKCMKFMLILQRT